MSGIASWARRYWPEILWGLFAGANFAVLFLIEQWETVPFHFIWVSLTLVYGFRVWRLGMTTATLVIVCVLSVATYGLLVVDGPQGPDELTEIPLMAATFLAMVWHARRRQAALEEVRLASEREREFVRAASHQLKTPLAIARGLADLIRQGDSPGSFDTDMADLVEELDRLGRVGDHLLLLASAEQPDSLVCAPVEIEDLVVSAVGRWSHAAARTWRVDVMTDSDLWADRERLDAVLDATIENAVKATDEGDVIAVIAREEGDLALLEVSDAGSGIPAEFMPRIFDRFWSMQYGPDRRRGTGLGLPIVRAIVEAHGGRVSVRSDEGRGTTVSIRVPGIGPSGAAAAAQARGAALAERVGR